MSNPIAQFLIDLSLNPSKLRKFRLDPAAFIDSGLSPEQLKALSSGDSTEVRRILTGSSIGGAPVTLVREIVLELTLDD
ncbi:MAG: hypothetical protein AAGD01_10020 [Acidobacteriota bacterium]